MTTVSSSVRSDVLHISLSGKFDSAEIGTVANTVLRLVDGSECSKVLIDKRKLEGRMLMAESYLALREYLPYVQGISAVFIELEKHKEIGEFQKHVLQSFGYGKITVFFDYNEGLRWLEKQ